MPASLNDAPGQELREVAFSAAYVAIMLDRVLAAENAGFDDDLELFETAQRLAIMLHEAQEAVDAADIGHLEILDCLVEGVRVQRVYPELAAFLPLDDLLTTRIAKGA